MSWGWGKVFYRPEQVVDASSYSKSPVKPKYVIEAWKERWPDLRFSSFEPIKQSDLYAVHDKKYVDDVFSGTRANGFSNRLPKVNNSLLYTSGSMMAAMNYAVKTGKVGVSPTSGFHHAGYGHGGGFCTFNGLMLAAVEATKRGCRVGILDCDQHYGDGTDDILMVLKSKRIEHTTMGEFYHDVSDVEDYLELLRIMRQKKWFSSLDLVLYQAGADSHADDSLGGVLNTEQMRERDRIVFESCFEASTPLVWCLAGGYQKPISKVVDLHVTTMEECISVFG